MGKIPLFPAASLCWTLSDLHTGSFSWLLQFLLFCSDPSVLPSLLQEHVANSQGHCPKLRVGRAAPLWGWVNRRVLKAFEPLAFSTCLKVRLMFPVTLGWTSVGGLTDNRHTWDIRKRHCELSAQWPSVGVIQTGSDKGPTTNCFLQFLLNANE